MNTVNLSACLWLLGIVMAAFGLYVVKYQVQELQQESAQLARELKREHETLHIVAAEWAYLNRPERLARLAAKYLDMKPMQGGQLAEFADVPYRVHQVAASGGEASLTLAGAR